LATAVYLSKIGYPCIFHQAITYAPSHHGGLLTIGNTTDLFEFLHEVERCDIKEMFDSYRNLHVWEDINAKKKQ